MRPLHFPLLALLMAGSPVGAAPSDNFNTIQDDYWAWRLREDPVLATRSGVRTYDDRIRDISLAAEDRRSAEEKQFLARIDAIPASALNTEDQVNRAILRRTLTESIEANGFPERVMLFTTYYGWQQEFASLSEDLPFRTAHDYRSYLARLAQYPKLNDQALAITEQAVKQGYVLPCSVLEGYESMISGVISADPAKSRFYQPFLKQRPTDASEPDWAAMQAQARRLIADVLNPAYEKHDRFYTTRYLPNCRKTDGIGSVPQGKAYYAFRVRQETTTNLTPDQIHQIGLSEVARIRSAMNALAARSGFPSREAMIEKLRTEPAYYPKSAHELLAEAALTAKMIEGRLPEYFGRLPRLPFGLRPIPAETAEGTTTAYYGPGSPAAGLSGTFYVNTSKLSQRPFWELPALTLHEAVPGHHLQIALQQELDLPEWRRNGADFTAFVEGWALYSEGLGEDMGLYDTPEKQMGRLSYDMWRACRLVVDTGIHAKGWMKAQAVAFMTDNTALSAANIEAEVNRYISWPGQALGYKVGELKIRELRSKAQTALGPKFDLRRFHDAVLREGPVPLDVLEQSVDRWIVAEQAGSAPA